MRQASSHQTLHDLKNTLRRESHTYTGGVISQAKCPPSRFPYIAVKFGAARHKWTGSEEGRFAGEGQLRGSASSRTQCAFWSPTKKVSNVNRLVRLAVLRRPESNSRIPCLEHGQEVSVVIAHVLPAHELDRQRQYWNSNSRLTRGEGEGQHKPKYIHNVGLCVGLNISKK